MRLSKVIVSLVALLIALNPLYAETQPRMEQLQVPLCLAAKITQPYQVLAENKAFKIINFPAADLRELVFLADKVGCGHFKNLTAQFTATNKEAMSTIANSLLLLPSFKATLKTAEHYTIRHQDAVKEAIAQINSTNLKQTLTSLTSYYNRSAFEETGYETALWLKAQFDSMVLEYGRQDTAAYFVKTGNAYRQPSLVTVIGKNKSAPAIVIGAHMDTLDGLMPGAGDDASGCATVLEMTRVLLASGKEFKHPIYIVWYAAEEQGLVGSQEVVKDFKTKRIPVKAAIQFDMTGFRHTNDDPTIWVFTDYTDPSLTTYLAKLIETYIKVPVKYSQCFYGCSDHASWTEKGIPAAFPCETSFENHNPNIHTAGDTMELLNIDHMTNFTKLALAFAIEIAS